jgi:hypothetical protein
MQLGKKISELCNRWAYGLTAGEELTLNREAARFFAPWLLDAAERAWAEYPDWPIFAGILAKISDGFDQYAKRGRKMADIAYFNEALELFSFYFDLIFEPEE